MLNVLSDIKAQCVIGHKGSMCHRIWRLNVSSDIKAQCVIGHGVSMSHRTWQGCSIGALQVQWLSESQHTVA